MKPDQMYYTALGAVIEYLNACNVWREMARTAESASEFNRANRKFLKAKAMFVVGFDREMDRLMKEYT